MKRKPSPELMQFLQGKLDALLATPTKDMTAAEITAHNQRIRYARMSIAKRLGTHTRQQWDAIVAETGGICVRCHYQHNLKFERPCKSYVIPIFLGGTNAIDNVQPLCRGCATAKTDERINWLERWRARKALDTENSNA